jgi:hypothetical protein
MDTFSLLVSRSFITGNGYYWDYVRQALRNTWHFQSYSQLTVYFRAELKFPGELVRFLLTFQASSK